MSKDSVMFSDYATGETIGTRKSSFRIEAGDKVHINSRAYTARSILYDASWMDASISCHVYLEQS